MTLCSTIGGRVDELTGLTVPMPPALSPAAKTWVVAPTAAVRAATLNAVATMAANADRRSMGHILSRLSALRGVSTLPATVRIPGPRADPSSARFRQRVGPEAVKLCDRGEVQLLLVEDDDSIAVPLARGLEREGFVVRRVTTGAEALAAEGYEMVLLDLGLPDMDGFTVCHELRTRGDVPIIVVTARGDEADRVVGLELGADDYLVKPFGFRELLARIRAVVRRAAPRPVDDLEPRGIGALAVDVRTHRVTVAGEEIALTPKEFDLLALLAEAPGSLYTRSTILEQVWDPHWYGPTKTLDVHVASVRKKLGDPGWIETVRGVGFRLVDPAEDV
jgi:DNA-binding response OmpR family regulator